MASGQGLLPPPASTARGDFVGRYAIGLPVTPDVRLVDPQAYIGHTGQLSSTIVTDLNWKTFVPGIGESYQVKFTGQGTVYIQASER